MTSQRLSRKNAFCISWILENFDFSLFQYPVKIGSPEFVVDTMDKTKWRLSVLQLPDRENVRCFLTRVEECEGPPNIEVEFQFELLAGDGSTLTSNVEKSSFQKGVRISRFQFQICKQMFRSNKSSHLPHGKLTVRCTMRKSNGYMETTACLARTIMGVKRRSFDWEFSYCNLLNTEKLTYRIKQASDEEIDITLHLSVCREESCDNMNIALVADFKRPIDFTFKYALFDALGKSIKCGEEKYCFFNVDNEWAFQLLSLEKEQSEKISSLPNDHLTLQCECAYATKITHHQIENIGQSQDSHRAQEHLHPSVTENSLSEPLNTLKDHLSSLHSQIHFGNLLQLDLSSDHCMKHRMCGRFIGIE
ncbi:TD and POZ domain-containing protein 1 [Caerostris darwini]|uniref:TD and POZ domain-containing protein 1 n=1 Tax=Caerostris darwini TaxID=1538125 RepID=A0AAV4T2Y4_9ARAC|nr:TD and POZ domain-containing protein 1 [Caerostris darwini]